VDSKRDLAGDVVAWLEQHGPATAEDIAAGVRARPMSVREVLRDHPAIGEPVRDGLRRLWSVPTNGHTNGHANGNGHAKSATIVDSAVSNRLATEAAAWADDSWERLTRPERLDLIRGLGDGSIRIRLRPITFSEYWTGQGTEQQRLEYEANQVRGYDRELRLFAEGRGTPEGRETFARAMQAYLIRIAEEGLEFRESYGARHPEWSDDNFVEEMQGYADQWGARAERERVAT
jgi:hypothetical protein